MNCVIIALIYMRSLSPELSEHMPEIMNRSLLELLLCAVLLGVIVDGLDGSIVNVILPTMAIDFGVDPGTISWVVVMYLLMLAGFILVFGKLADTGLLRKIFILGFIFFTIGSAVCGLSPNFVPFGYCQSDSGIRGCDARAAAPLFCIRYLPFLNAGSLTCVLTVGSSIGFAQVRNRRTYCERIIMALGISHQCPDRDLCGDFYSLSYSKRRSLEKMRI